MGNEIRDAGVPIPAGVPPFVSVPPQVINTEKVTNTEKIIFYPQECKVEFYSDLELLIKQTKKELEVNVGSLIFPLKTSESYTADFQTMYALRRELIEQLRGSSSTLRDNGFGRLIMKNWENALKDLKELREYLAGQVANYHRDEINNFESQIKKEGTVFLKRVNLYRDALNAVAKITKEGEERSQLIKIINMANKWSESIKSVYSIGAALAVKVSRVVVQETILGISSFVRFLGDDIFVPDPIPELSDSIIKKATFNSIQQTLFLLSDGQSLSVKDLERSVIGTSQNFHELQKQILRSRSNLIDAVTVQQHNPYLIDEK